MISLNLNWMKKVKNSKYWNTWNYETDSIFVEIWHSFQWNFYFMKYLNFRFRAVLNFKIIYKKFNFKFTPYRCKVILIQIYNTCLVYAVVFVDSTISKLKCTNRLLFKMWYGIYSIIYIECLLVYKKCAKMFIRFLRHRVFRVKLIVYIHFILHKKCIFLNHIICVYKLYIHVNVCIHLVKTIT